MSGRRRIRPTTLSRLAQKFEQSDWFKVAANRSRLGRVRPSRIWLAIRAINSRRMALRRLQRVAIYGFASSVTI
jgi:hypothetical protein